VKRRKSHSADAATTRRGQAEGRQGNDGQRNVWQGNKTKRFSSHASADHSVAKFLRKRLILADGRTKQTLGRDRTRDRIRHFTCPHSQFPKALFQRAKRVSATTTVIYHAVLGLQMENNEQDMAGVSHRAGPPRRGDRSGESHVRTVRRAVRSRTGMLSDWFDRNCRRAILGQWPFPNRHTLPRHVPLWVDPQNSDESWREKADCLLANPVRKGLVTEVSQWPYVFLPNSL
jgi:hypothetical protein